MDGIIVRLCSAYSEDHRLTCDLPAEHEGEHKATVFWGNNGES